VWSDVPNFLVIFHVLPLHYDIWLPFYYVPDTVYAWLSNFISEIVKSTKENLVYKSPNFSGNKIEFD